jgi:hypothetical protein
MRHLSILHFRGVITDMKVIRFITYIAMVVGTLMLLAFAIVTGRSYIDIHNSVKNRVMNVFLTLPGDSYIRQAHFDYMRATGRGHFNQVTFLTDGRLMSDNLEPNVYLYERADSFAQLRDYLDGNDIPFLYIRVPSKIEDNTPIPQAFSDNHIIESADKLVQLIRAESIDVLDLRAEMMRENMDFTDSFYRKDIHWTTETALWASNRIGAHLIRAYGFELDESVWDRNRYESITFENVWQGNEAQFANARRSFEDITALFPSFDTELAITGRAFDVWGEGNFIDVFMPMIRNEHIERLGYLDLGLAEIIFTRLINLEANNNKNVLLIADSFGLIKAPFFSLGFERLDFLYLINQHTSAVIWDIIDENEYDIVILAVSDDVVSLESRPKFEEDRLFFGHPGSR